MSDKSEAISEVTKAGAGKARNFFGAVGRFIKRHKILTFLVILVVIAAIVFGVVRARLGAAAPVKSTQQQTTSLTKMDLSTSISVTGTIASADARSVSAEVSNVEVKEVNVAVGDYVNAGDTIITLDSSDIEEELETVQESYELESTKIQKNVSDAAESITDAQEAYEDGEAEQAAKVSDALSQYNLASSAEADRKAEYEKAQEQTEKAKEAYNKLKEEKNTRKSAQSEAKKANDKAQKALAEAKAAYEAAQATAKDENGNVDATVYQAYVDAQSAAEQAQKAYDKAVQDYNKIEEAKTAYSEAQKAQEEALAAYEGAVGTTSTKYAEYENAVSEQNETNEKNAEAIDEKEYDYTITSKEASSSLKSKSAQLQETEEKLGECVVTAPISGVITSISVEAGDTYEGGEMFTVQDMTAFVVDATVDEYDISDIAKDMTAVIKTDATDEDELAGVVTYVAPTPESSSSSGSSGASMGSSSSSSASYKIQITLSETDDRLRVGMTAKTSIVLDAAQNVFAVPYDCVQTDTDGSYYIMVVEGGMNSQKEMKRPNSQNTEEESTAADEQNTEAAETENTEAEQKSKERPNRAEGETPSTEAADSTARTQTEADTQTTSTKITVEKGMESDYYVQIIADELQEGMQVVIPTTTETQAAGSNAQAGFSLDALTGGGSTGGGGGRGDRASGGGPGGGGAPGGF